MILFDFTCIGYDSSIHVLHRFYFKKRGIRGVCLGFKNNLTKVEGAEYMRVFYTKQVAKILRE